MSTALKKHTDAASKPTSRKPKAAEAPSTRRADKDLPLMDDIRLLGRILGDVIREQEGQAAFDLIEQVR
ncbi:MAG: hypothetical protein RSD82_13265, partial [Comamonas sp.]